MAKSFVFRDRERRIVGYLQQNRDEIRCRITGIEQEADLIIYHVDARETRLHMDTGGCEKCFPDSGRCISGAVVVQGDALRLFTDEAAAEAYERAYRCKTEKQRRADRTLPREDTEKAAAPEGEKEEAALPDAKTEQPGYSWPERRWPPPACLPGAAYVQGRWMERETEQPEACDHEGR